MTLEQLLTSISSLFKDTKDFLEFHKQANDIVTGLIKSKSEEIEKKKDEEIVSLTGKVKDLTIKPIDNEFFKQFTNGKDGKDKVDNTEFVKRILSAETLSDDPEKRAVELKAFSEKYATVLEKFKPEQPEQPEQKQNKPFGIDDALLEKATAKQNKEDSKKPEETRSKEELLEDLSENMDLE